MADKPKLKPGQRVQSRSQEVRTYCKLLDQSISRWIDAVMDDTPGPSRIKEERMHEIADEAKYLGEQLAAIAIVWNVPEVVPTFRAMLADKVSPYNVYVDSLGDSDWATSIAKNVQPLRDAAKQMRIHAGFVETSENVYRSEPAPATDLDQLGVSAVYLSPGQCKADLPSTLTDRQKYDRLERIRKRCKKWFHVKKVGKAVHILAQDWEKLRGLVRSRGIEALPENDPAPEEISRLKTQINAENLVNRRRGA